METMDRNAGRSRAIPDRCGAQNAALYARTALNAQHATVSNFCMLWFTGTWRPRSPSQSHTATGRRSSLLAPSYGRCSRMSGRLPTATLRPSTSASAIGASGQRSRATRRRSSQSAWHMHAHSSISLFFSSLRHVYSHAPPLPSTNRILLQCWEVEPARRPELSAVLPVLDELLRQHGDYRPTTAPGGTSRSRRASRG